MMKWYLVTLRVVQTRYYSREEINEVLETIVKSLKGYSWSNIYGYELDSKDRWHVHTICQGPRKPFLKRFNKNGVHPHFEEIEDWEGDKHRVIAYVGKDDQNSPVLDENDWTSRARYEYLFR